MDLRTFSIMEILKDVKTDYEIILDLYNQLSNLMLQRPFFDIQSRIHAFLQSKLGDTDLTKSFNKKLIILYNGNLFPEILIGIHSWLFTKAGNIENIILLCTQTQGVKEWYQLYLNFYGIKGLTIIEAPFTIEQYKDDWLVDVPQFDTKMLDKQIKYMFSYYGGSRGTIERDFLAAALSSVPNGFVDYWANFSSDEKEFTNYLEQFTNFCDKSLVDQILESRNNFKFIEGYRLKDESWQNNSTKNIDTQTACSVIRETVNLSQYCNMNYKTLRAFMYLQFAIPISGHKSVEYLERLGFVFNHKLIDYSYQYEYDVCKRIKLLIKELHRLSKDYTLNDWQEIIHDNAEMLCYNYNYFAQGTVLEVIKKNVIGSIDE